MSAVSLVNAAPKRTPIVTLSKEMILLRHEDQEATADRRIAVEIAVFGNYVPRVPGIYQGDRAREPEGGYVEVDDWKATLPGGHDVSDYFWDEEVTAWADEEMAKCDE
ncbi:MAG: hypothetical protein R3221_12615 [Spongiibacter sp.]|nr:hypothetical protein [Spongiibacter sp.]